MTARRTKRIARTRADSADRIRRIRPKSAESAHPRGQLVVVAVFLLALVLALSVASVSITTISGKATTAVSRQRAANEAAAAGIEKAVFCLNQTSGTNCGGTYGSSYTGETNIGLSATSTFTTTVATIDQLTREITSTGYFPNATNPLVRQVIRARVGINSDDVSFNYAVQVGTGGLEMDNNATVNGNVYSNWDVTGNPNTSVVGDVWVAGGIQLTADQQATATTTNQSVGQVSSNEDVAQSFTPSQSQVLNKVSLYLKKVGNPGNKTVRILADNNGVPSKTELADGTLPSSSVGSAYGWIDVSMTDQPMLTAGTVYWIVIDSSSNASNYYHWGLDQNSGYGNGTGMVSSNWNGNPPVWTSAGGDLAFKAWLGGVVTKLSAMNVTGDAHANTIENSAITGDAYYQTITGSTVGGQSNPGSADPPTRDFPISDSLINEWKQDATAGGVIAGDYLLTDNASDSLGPVEITGNMRLDNNVTLTVTGTVYVRGTITIQNNATVRLDPAYGSSSGVVIADGTINLSNNTIFQGAGAGSFIMFLSTSAAEPAIDINNNAVGAIFYAANGEVEVENNVEVTSVTAKTIHLKNNATLNYDIGLADAVFTSGPGGSWVLQKGTWREIK